MVISGSAFAAKPSRLVMARCLDNALLDLAKD